MSRTSIEWTDVVWNPVRGCSRVSLGCVNCYAERIAARFSDEGQPFQLFADRARSGSKWTGNVALIEEKLMEPLRWRDPRRVFVNSMSDLFHEKLSDIAIDRIWEVMLACPQHTFQILTKRAERMMEYLSGETAGGRAHHHNPPGWIWLGVSVENQQVAEERIPHLLASPAAVRFLSCEPLLGPIDLRAIPRCLNDNKPTQKQIDSPQGLHYVRRGAPGIDWVIVGGESGPGARPVHIDWVRSLRDQCVEAGVSFFFKQWGEYAPEKCRFCADPDGPHSSLRDCTCGAEKMARVGKKAAGRSLDGDEWSEFPEVSRCS